MFCQHDVVWLGMMTQSVTIICYCLFYVMIIVDKMSPQTSAIIHSEDRTSWRMLLWHMAEIQV